MNKPKIPNDLGPNLPDIENKLFELADFPLLDIQSAIQSMGSEELVRDLLQLMLATEATHDIEDIKKAYLKQDWETIGKLVHKIQGGATYCSTMRLKYACQYFESYQRNGHSALLEPLYQQFITVIEDTQDFLKQWLNYE